MLEHIDDQMAAAVAFLGASAVSWGTWITNKVFKQDNRLDVLCTKIDMMHEDVRDIKKNMKGE